MLSSVIKSDEILYMAFNQDKSFLINSNQKPNIIKKKVVLHVELKMDLKYTILSLVLRHSLEVH